MWSKEDFPAIRFCLMYIALTSVVTSKPHHHHHHHIMTRDTNNDSEGFILPEVMTMSRRKRERISADLHKLVMDSINHGTECTMSNSSNSNLPIYARSICPWYYELQHDPDRFPASIPVAVKRCKRTDNCIGLVDDNFGCEYVYHNVTVLKKTCDNPMRYIQVEERIPVASTCVRKSENIYS